MTQQTLGATIVISRKRGGWRDWARSYLVMLDDQDVGKIKRGERLGFRFRPARTSSS
jgi:hypothetical protein